MIMPPGVIEVVLTASVVTVESVKAPETRIIELIREQWNIVELWNKPLLIGKWVGYLNCFTH